MTNNNDNFFSSVLYQKDFITDFIIYNDVRSINANADFKRRYNWSFQIFNQFSSVWLLWFQIRRSPIAVEILSRYVLFVDLLIWKHKRKDWIHLFVVEVNFDIFSCRCIQQNTMKGNCRLKVWQKLKLLSLKSSASYE